MLVCGSGRKKTGTERPKVEHDRRPEREEGEQPKGQNDLEPQHLEYRCDSTLHVESSAMSNCDKMRGRLPTSPLRSKKKKTRIKRQCIPVELVDGVGNTSRKPVLGMALRIESADDQKHQKNAHGKHQKNTKKTDGKHGISNHFLSKSVLEVPWVQNNRECGWCRGCRTVKKNG